MGNLTRDPELRMTPSGSAIAKFSIATNRAYTNQAGQKIEEVTFVEVDAFGKQAETIGKYFTKGKPIFLEGRLKLNQWEKEGQKFSKLTVVLEEFQFVGGKAEGGGAAQEPAGAPPAKRPTPAPAPKNDFADDDSVPF